MKRAHNRADYDLNVKDPDRRRKLRSGLIMRLIFGMHILVDDLSIQDDCEIRWYTV